MRALPGTRRTVDAHHRPAVNEARVDAEADFLGAQWDLSRIWRTQLKIASRFGAPGNRAMAASITAAWRFIGCVDSTRRAQHSRHWKR